MSGWRVEDRSGKTSGGRFPLGQTVATPGALEALAQACVTPQEICARHRRGDWGDALPAEDAAMNDQEVDAGGRLLSAYWLPGRVKLWVITEWDRSVTTILLPEEY